MELIGLAILIIMCVVAPWIIKTILEFMGMTQTISVEMDGLKLN